MMTTKPIFRNTKNLADFLFTKKNFDKLYDRAFQQFNDRVRSKKTRTKTFISHVQMGSDFLIAAWYHYCILCRNRSMYFTGNQRLSITNHYPFGRISRDRI